MSEGEREKEGANSFRQCHLVGQAQTRGPERWRSRGGSPRSGAGWAAGRCPQVALPRQPALGERGEPLWAAQQLRLWGQRGGREGFSGYPVLPPGMGLEAPI